MTDKDLHRHGGPYDRGSADAYYRRPRDPHYFTGATYTSERIGKDRMTIEQLSAYNQGYDSETDQKDWGQPPLTTKDEESDND